jgi:diacylglycerol kinase (ATP)
MNDIGQSPFKGKKGFKRIVQATNYSFAGLRAAWEFEAAFRQICTLAVVGVCWAFFMPMPIWMCGLIVLSHMLSVIVEILNSAIEAAVDHTSLEHNPLAKRAKDLGSAAQFVSLINILIMWLIAIYK